MSLRYSADCRERIAVDLYAFFEPTGCTDETFDQICGWVPGSTRELLEKIRFPSHAELIEICHRANLPLSRYVVSFMPDGGPPREEIQPRRCTEQDPCCEKRLEYNGYQSGPLAFRCPRNCPCHD